MQKLCRECGIRKPYENFHNKGHTSAGNIKRSSVCKDCKSIVNRRFKSLYGADGLKECSKCSQHLTWDCFRRRKQDGKLYLHSSCNACNRVIWDKWIENNKERYQKTKKEKAKLLHDNHKKYERRGITKEQYNIVFEAQKGLCAICKKPPKDEHCLAMDHNHKTNEFRGLLCKECNRALGLFGDNIDILTNAVTYLKERGSYG
jgi:hypothetical protein